MLKPLTGGKEVSHLILFLKLPKFHGSNENPVIEES